MNRTGERTTLRNAERTYSITEAAAVAGVDRATVRNLAAAGRLRGAQRIGKGAWRIPASAVANMVEYVQSNHSIRLHGDPLTGDDAQIIELGVRVEARASRSVRGRVAGDAA